MQVNIEHKTYRIDSILNFDDENNDHRFVDFVY